MPDSPDKDPVVSQSLAVYLLISSVLLLLTLWWSLYDEFFGLRPWKDYQRAFVQRYGAFLRKQVPLQRAKEKAIENSPDYLALKQKLGEIEKETAPKIKELDAKAAQVDARTAAVLNLLTTARAYVGSQIYIIEHTSSRGSKQSLAQLRKGPSMPHRKLALLVAVPFLFAAAALAETVPAGPRSERPDFDRAAMHKTMCVDMYAHQAARLAYIEAKLDLTAEQRPAWTKWQQANLAAAAKERSACLAAAPKAEGRPTALEREERAEKFLTLKLQTLQSTRPALQALYAELTPAQKKVFDHSGRGHGHFGHGEGHGHQWFGGMHGQH